MGIKYNPATDKILHTSNDLLATTCPEEDICDECPMQVQVTIAGWPGNPEISCQCMADYNGTWVLDRIGCGGETTLHCPQEITGVSAQYLGGSATGGCISGGGAQPDGFQFEVFIIKDGGNLHIEFWVTDTTPSGEPTWQWGVVVAQSCDTLDYTFDVDDRCGVLGFCDITPVTIRVQAL